MRLFLQSILFLSIVSLISSCAVDKTVINMFGNAAADAFSKPGGTVFTGENDPELVGESMPFALKLYETILEQTPEHSGLLLSTGSAYIMYANAYLQGPAGMLPSTEFDKREHLLKRSKNLYLRGRDMVLKGLEIRHRNFTNNLFQNKTNEALSMLNKDDVPYLYWISAGWTAAFSVDADLELSMGLPYVFLMVQKALALDPDYSSGALHDFLISFYASMPAHLGGNPELAFRHFELALAASGTNSASPFVSLASSIYITRQDKIKFIELMEQALAINADKVPSMRLANILSQRKARWYLDHTADFFIED